LICSIENDSLNIEMTT